MGKLIAGLVTAFAVLTTAVVAALAVLVAVKPLRIKAFFWAIKFAAPYLSLEDLEKYRSFAGIGKDELDYGHLVKVVESSGGGGQAVQEGEALEKEGLQGLSGGLRKRG